MSLKEKLSKVFQKKNDTKSENLSEKPKNSLTEETLKIEIKTEKDGSSYLKVILEPNSQMTYTEIANIIGTVVEDKLSCKKTTITEEQKPEVKTAETETVKAIAEEQPKRFDKIVEYEISKIAPHYNFALELPLGASKYIIAIRIFSDSKLDKNEMFFVNGKAYRNLDGFLGQINLTNEKFDDLIESVDVNNQSFFGSIPDDYLRLRDIDYIKKKDESKNLPLISKEAVFYYLADGNKDFNEIPDYFFETGAIEDVLNGLAKNIEKDKSLISKIDVRLICNSLCEKCNELIEKHIKQGKIISSIHSKSNEDYDFVLNNLQNLAKKYYLKPEENAEDKQNSAETLGN